MYLKKIAVVLLVLLIPFSMAKAPDKSAAHSYNAGGYVFDDRGFALDGVAVSGGGIENITDREGHYIITGISSGTYKFSYSKTGFDTGYLKVTVNDADVVNANITLYKTAPPSKVTAFIPPAPENLASTRGNFWINHSWKAGSGNATDSYNINVNGVWKNGIKSTYYNSTVGAHGWSNISVWAYNSSGRGSLSPAPASQDTQVPDNPISLSGIQDSYQITEGQILYIDANYSDADGDTGTFTDNSGKWDVDPSTGTVVWATNESDEGTYNWYINVSDGYGSIATKSFTVTVGDSTPGTPLNLVNETGNFWINYTWYKGANTDSFNVSFNGIWTNGTTDAFISRTLEPHGWGNITVYGWNNTLKSLSRGVSRSAQIPNNPPVQLPIGAKEMYKGQLLTFKINTTDADSDIVHYGTNATRGNLDSSTGIYAWSPADSDEGVYIWEFSSSDDYGGKASETVKVTLRNPLDVHLKLIEPGLIDDNGTRVETWHDAKTGHFGKLIGYSSTFKNTGNSSLVVRVTEFYNNKSYDNNSFTVMLAENESKPCQDRVSNCRLAFEIDPAGIKNGIFNFTLQMDVRGYSGPNFIFNYTNSTTISLPIIPVYRIKRADGGMAVVTGGRTTTVTYTLEANSTVNLTNVSIYDPFYPEKFFNISNLEANNPRNVSFSYPATTADLSKFKCEEPYSSCILNLATLTARTESGDTVTDTDYVRLPLCRDTDKDCLAGAAITRLVEPSSGSGSSGGNGGGGGGAGMAPSEDTGNIERREVREMDILSRVSSAYVFRAADPVLVVAFESSVSENEVPVSVEVLKSRSKNIKDDAPGKLYKYFNVFAGTSGFSRKVGNGVVAFRVNNTWLEENGLDPEDISMYKWQGSWVKKETEIADRKANYTYYASLTGNFSSFAVVGVKRPEAGIPVSIPQEEPVKNTTQTSANSNFSKTKQPGGFLELSAAFVLVCGAMGAVYYLRRDRKI